MQYHLSTWPHHPCMARPHCFALSSRGRSSTTLRPLLKYFKSTFKLLFRNQSSCDKASPRPYGEAIRKSITKRAQNGARESSVRKRRHKRRQRPHFEFRVRFLCELPCRAGLQIKAGKCKSPPSQTSQHVFRVCKSTYYILTVCS